MVNCLLVFLYQLYIRQFCLRPFFMIYRAYLCSFWQLELWFAGFLIYPSTGEEDSKQMYPSSSPVDG